MKAFIIYQAEVAVILTALYIFYHFLLRNETQFFFKRIYFILSIILSLALPFITIKLSSPAPLPLAIPLDFTNQIAFTPTQITAQTDPQNWDLWSILFFIWLVGFLFFLLRLIISLVRIFEILGMTYPDPANSRIRKTNLNIHSFSFFKFIVLNTKHDKSSEKKFVLEHELTHSRQLHSADVLLCELIRCMQWFNPFAWLLIKKVIINLEFLADQQVLKKYNDIDSYPLSMLHFAQSASYSPMKIEFSKLHLKERIHMMARPSKRVPPLKWIGIFTLLSILSFTITVKGSPKEITEKVNQSLSHLIEPVPLQISDYSVNQNSPEPIAQVEETQQKPQKVSEASIKVSGKVVSKEGPVAGASVIAESLNLGTITDIEGDFFIELPQNTELAIAKSGYVKSNFAVKSKSSTLNLGIILIENSNQANSVSEETTPIEEEKEINSIDQVAPDSVKVTSIVTDTNTYKGQIFPNTSENDLPLMIIDNVEYEGKEGLRLLEKLYQGTIQRITSLTPQSAMPIYGEKAKNGAVIFELNDSNWTNVGYAGNLSLWGKGLKGIKVYYDREKLSPIFIINNIEYSNEEGLKRLDKIRITEVDKVHLFEGKAAIQRYGEKGENGVIIIKLKN